MIRPYRVFMHGAKAPVATFANREHAHRYAGWLSCESGVAVRVVLVDPRSTETHYYAGKTANPLV
jgi:hypothetical protein